jgi:hypothetical protein
MEFRATESFEFRGKLHFMNCLVRLRYDSNLYLCDFLRPPVLLGNLIHFLNPRRYYCQD